MNDHYRALLRQVNQATHDPDLEEGEMREGLRGVLELVSEPLDAPFHNAVLANAWEQGYEQCMIDIIEALADEWGVGEETYREVNGDHGGDRR